MKNINCKVFGHDFEVTRNVTYHVKEYTCKTCNKQLTTNGNGNLVPLTSKFKEINDVLERIYNKRLLRLKKQKTINLPESVDKSKLLVFSH
jgi:NMD protein affecting ribosome stability and mRNA decay